jgi:dihydroorotate dehydrogenase
VEDLENWHNKVRELLNLVESHPELISLASQFPRPTEIVKSKRLHTNLAGIKLANPLMVGAGWDKAGKVVRSLTAMGFAGVEVGSVQNYPQEGNPLPRHFELAEGVTINRYGFNSPGAQEVANNLKAYEKDKLIIGLNIGKNKEIPDIATLHMVAAVAERLYKYVSYIVVNVSSPNTPGLRKLLAREPLDEIVKAVVEVVGLHKKKLPIFIKLSPDLTNKAIDDVIEVALENNIQGIVAVNTTTSQNIKGSYGKNWRYEAGGLSGNDEAYRKNATRIIAYVHSHSKAKLTIIGAGGVCDTQTALEKLRAGASAVQIVTAIRYRGLNIANEINRGLIDWMDQNGVKNISEIVGSEVK